jgi:hypothetical protein
VGQAEDTYVILESRGSVRCVREVQIRDSR